MLKGIEVLNYNIKKYSDVLPYVAMTGTTLLVAISQWPLIWSVGAIAFSGGITFGAAQIAQLLSKVNAILTDAQVNTIPKANTTLDQLDKLLPVVNAFVYDLDHPGQDIEKGVQVLGAEAKGKASHILTSFMNIFHRTQAASTINPLPPSAPAPAPSTSKLKLSSSGDSA